MRRFVALCIALVALAGALLAQKKDDKDVCPYCGNDPELMAKAGLVNHGPFDFGANGIERAETLLAAYDVKWLQSKHFEIGFALGAWKVKDDEKKKFRAELEKLAAVLPKVDPKERVIDPWLRTHLYAQRCEEIYARVQELLGVDDSMFPDGTKPWDTTGKYMGEGPYMGQKGKFEVLLLPAEAALTTYLKNEFGLPTKKNQRWNITDKDTITVVINITEGSLREDMALHGHVGFNLAINMLDAFKHYSYDTPIWIREGLGHFVEREITPKYNTFDSSEGSVAAMTSKAKWEPEVKKLVAAGEAPRMAELVNMKDYADLTLPTHFVTWSMVDFLVKTNPKGFACLNDAIHGRTDAKGYADGSNLLDVHRESFPTCLGYATYQEFDAAWAAWVTANYASQ
ncbi:MAG: hypothetical protein L6Q99_04170 [Planctomycetes bacterium]|nr:hypothetical protein [Planctomycetota bacterium]